MKKVYLMAISIAIATMSFTSASAFANNLPSMTAMSGYVADNHISNVSTETIKFDVKSEVNASVSISCSDEKANANTDKTDPIENMSWSVVSADTRLLIPRLVQIPIGDDSHNLKS